MFDTCRWRTSGWQPENDKKSKQKNNELNVFSHLSLSLVPLVPRSKPNAEENSLLLLFRTTLASYTLLKLCDVLFVFSKHTKRYRFYSFRIFNLPKTQSYSLRIDKWFDRIGKILPWLPRRLHRLEILGSMPL